MSASQAGVYDIHRFYNTQTGAHFFTASADERDIVLSNYPQFQYEGNAFDSNAQNGVDADATPVFRFYNTETGVHFYTASADERDLVLSTYPHFAYEGIAYYAYQNDGADREALYRFYNTETGTHFYTASEAERDHVIATYPQYSFEGVAYYVGGTNPNESKDDPGSGLDYTGGDGKVEVTTFDVPGVLANDVSIQTQQSADLISLTAFRADSRFAGIDGSGQTIVIIDTGIDLNHPAFGPDSNGDGVSDRIVYHQDFSNDFDGTANDVQGHGSHVASIAAGSSGAATGIAPGANIIALQALGNDGRGSDADIEKALQWVVNNAAAYNITAVNMSLGNGSNINSEAPNPSGYADELSALARMGVITIAAAGNDYGIHQREGASDLAADPNTIAVGAVWTGNFGKISFSSSEDNTTAADRVASFSQRSDDLPTILAPGALITGAAPGGGTIQLAGTSMAAPQIAGVAALAQQLALQHLGRQLTPIEFENLLVRTGDVIFDGDDEDDNVLNSNTSYARVDVLELGNAIMALGGGTTPTPTPTDTIADSTATTAVLTVGTDFSSSIDFQSDSDWIGVSLVAGQSYTFEALGQPSSAGTLADPRLSLRDGLGNLVAFDDDSGTGLESLLTYTPTSSGTYYVDIKGYSTLTGSYVVRSSTDGSSADIPDNSSTSATITTGQTTTGTLDFASDVDWYRVTLSSGSTYQVDLKGSASAAGTIVDPYVRLYDSSGRLVAYDDDSGTGLESQMLYTATSSGTYYVSAGSFRASDTGTFALSLSLLGQVSTDIPGDTSTTSEISAGGGAQTSSLDVAGDTDWFRFDVTAGSEYQIDLEGIGANELRDPLVRIYTAAGVEVASDDDSGAGLDSKLIYRADDTQTLYISAESFYNGHSGDYQLTVLQTAVGSADIPGDISTTQTLALDTPVESALGFAGDEDWFALDVVAGTTYEISLSGIGGDELRDPLVRLYSSSGAVQLAYDDDSGSGLDSQLSYTASATGTVYVSAEAYAGAYTGGYRLQVSSQGFSSGDFPGDTSTPANISVGQTGSGSLYIPGDTDWFRLTLTESRTLNIALDGVGTNELPDPLVRLFDSSGQQLAYDDDSGPGLDSLLVYSATPGVYYIGADAYGSNYAGDYWLSVT